MSLARDRRWRSVRGALLACALLAVVGVVRAQALGGDAGAKAKLVATLARFVQWPPATFESETAPLRLCVFSSSPTVERAFQSQAEIPIGARPVQTLMNPRTVAKNCHLVYVDESGALRADQMLKRLGSEPTFTVGTQDGFVGDGGMVEIVHVDNTLRFDFNLVALREAGLGVNPGVLKLARQVRQ